MFIAVFMHYNHADIINWKAHKASLNTSNNMYNLFDLYLEGFFQEEEALKKAFESDIAATSILHLVKTRWSCCKDCIKTLFRNMETPITS